ncbi:MAG: STAS domain-containing protein [Clostridia bacterium]|nr:STAS domain-containing protein [Clostridia bacterium]
MKIEHNVGLSVQERVNPVFNTAKTAVCLMARAGIPEAEEIVEQMGIDSSLLGEMSDPDILLGNAVVEETKYRTMCRLIEDSGYRCNVDLPCGFTPKALHMTENGLSFVGLDLPVVAREAGEVFFSLAIHPEKMSFHGVDATNYQSLERALQDVDGPLCITTEGMLMYFTNDEAYAVASNIRRLLEKHGGCWITPDPEFMLQFMLTFRALFGENLMKKLADSGRNVKQQSGVADLNNSMILKYTNMTATAKAAEAFLEKNGLKVKKLNLAEHMPELSIYRELTEEQIARFKDLMQECNYWFITLDEARKMQEEVSEQPFGMDYAQKGKVLQMALRGRVDTITAPDILAVWETQKAVHAAEEVRIDCSKLDYISSAGLRVLLIMHKNCSRGVLLSGVSRLVKQILEQTGFDSIIRVGK